MELINKAMCEVCGKNEANSFSSFGYHEDKIHWLFVCMCTNEDEDYYIRINDYYRDVDKDHSWLDHLEEKTWFKRGDFISMIKRYELLNNSVDTIKPNC